MALNFLVEPSGDWYNASNWMHGVPAAGDTAVIFSGSSTITGTHTLRNLTVDVSSATASETATLDVNNAHLTLAWSTTLATGALDGGDPQAPYVGHVDVTASTLTNNGGVLAEGAHAQMIMTLNSGVFVNNGFTGAVGSGTDIDFNGVVGTANDVTNNSMLAAYGGTVNLNTSVIGNGVLEVGGNGHMTVNAGVHSGQFVDLESGMLEITNPARMAFQATVGNLTSASTFQVDGGYSDSAARTFTISDVSCYGETLNLMAGGQDIFSVKLSGHYSLSDFHLGQLGGNAIIAYDHLPPVYGI